MWLNHDEFQIGIMDSTDQPNSICHVQTIQMYQLPPTDDKQPHFKLLAGEAVYHSGQSVDGLILLTNYRLYLQIADNHHHIPLGLIEQVEHRDLFYLHIGCKDARTFRVIFSNNESCLEWFDRIAKFSEPPRQLEQLFAFYHFIWAKDRGGEQIDSRALKKYTFDYRLFKNEMDRLQFEGDSWRISEANKNYKLCPTYPPYLIVPSCINDETLECVAKFRSSRRIPAVVWRHQRNGAVIARCSQPEVGWLGWRSSEDEDLIKAISQACNFDQRIDTLSTLSQSPGGSVNSDTDSLQQITTELAGGSKKVLIMDARSYTTAVANRARGGGCECPEYYPNCEIQFMNLANIHSIRKSFHALRLLCTSSADQSTWFSQLEGTRWLQHMSGLMKAAVTLVNAIEREARPVLVHCSDGWDRTPQIIALAELLLDPYYRTRDGFRILIEREWLAFGHKFADRCGHSSGSDDQNERCPVFLQWLDCVHQLVMQFSCSFEFTQSYLVKLAQHVYSNLYGTFLANTFQERMRMVMGKTFSVWEFLNGQQFRNHLYNPAAATVFGEKDKEGKKQRVLWPQCNVRDLYLWNEVYLGSWENNNGGTAGVQATVVNGMASPTHNNMTKTRSFGDLKNAATAAPIVKVATATVEPMNEVMSAPTMRRSSDPSINIDVNKKLNLDETMSTNKSRDGNYFQCELLMDDCNKDCIYNNQNVIRKTNEIDDDDEDDDLDEDIVDSGKFFLDNNTKTEEEDDELNRILPIPPPPSYQNGTTTATTDDENSNNSDDKTTATLLGDHLTNCCSIETSTDTLVSSSINGTNQESEIDMLDGCRVCAENFKFVNDDATSKPIVVKTKAALVTNGISSTSPLYSQTSSGSGWDNGLPLVAKLGHSHSLDDDGLIPIRSPAQERLMQIIDEHKRKLELMERELHTYRQALINQFCHKCSNADCERIDDNGSVVESVGSVGEGQASAVESLRSDLSWEALEENSILTECTATLWVPDHAVSRCTGCQTEFWVGKRKHHCRKCGRIFCASCSENSTPLPSEQLYEPVRVCTGCYSKLRRDCGELPPPDQCKHAAATTTNGHHHHHHHHHQTPTTNQQITASSN